uniref:Secreted protein n=1 Tax=Arundo donax TaxID=35708 RepID=A0A0A9GNR0_ARUDO
MFQRRCSALLLPAFVVGIESALSLQVATQGNHHAGGTMDYILRPANTLVCTAPTLSRGDIHFIKAPSP